MRQQTVSRLNTLCDQQDLKLVLPIKKINNREYATLICKLHGQFDVRVDSVREGQMLCKRCARECRANATLQKAIKRYEEKYGTDVVDFSQTHYINLETPITVICAKCGNSITLRLDHLFERGADICPKCKKDRYDREELKNAFLQKAAKNFSNIHIVSAENYINKNSLIKLNCPKHGVFQMTALQLINSVAGCPLCGREINANKRKKSFSQFVKKAREIHGFRYSYDECLYTDYYTPIKIFDTVDNTYFYQKPIVHANGHGNPHFNSRGNARIKDWCIKNNIQYVAEYKVSGNALSLNQRNVYIDFKLIYNNKEYWVEFLGILHYIPFNYFGGKEKFEKVQHRDWAVRNYCKLNNIKLIEIPFLYDSYSKIDELLTNIILNNDDNFPVRNVTKEDVQKYTRRYFNNNLI